MLARLKQKMIEARYIHRILLLTPVQNNNQWLHSEAGHTSPRI